jgi:hypothetical protein
MGITTFALLMRNKAVLQAAGSGGFLEQRRVIHRAAGHSGSRENGSLSGEHLQPRFLLSD